MTLSIETLSMTLTKPVVEPFILLVDDHEPTLRKLQQVVECAGYPSVATCSAPEALALSDARRPALVVTDLSMPQLDGRGLARWLKARYPSIPIILVTGELLDASTTSAFQRTFAAVLPKPLHVEAFLDLVANLMPRPECGRRPRT